MQELIQLFDVIFTCINKGENIRKQQEQLVFVHAITL